MTDKRTPGPWDESKHARSETFGTPKAWTCVRHEFHQPPYEGDLESEWGIYPPLGQAGPVALVSGEANAHFIAAAPLMLDALEAQVAFDNHCHSCESCQDGTMCEVGIDLSTAAQAKQTAALAKAKGEPAPIEASQAGGQPPDAVRVPREVYHGVLDSLDYLIKFLPSGPTRDHVVRDHERLKMCGPTAERAVSGG